VTAEVTVLDGVSAVAVELAPNGVSTVTVTSAAPLPETELVEALDEAGGYHLA